MIEDKTKVLAVLSVLLLFFAGLFVYLAPVEPTGALDNELKLRRGPVPVIALVESCDLGIWGNGFFIQDDLVLTAYHLIVDSNMVSIDGQVARVVYLDPSLDLALLEVKTSTVEFSAGFSRANLRPLQLVKCLSKLLLPRGVQLEVQGRVAAVDVKDEFFSPMFVDYLDMSAQPGFSGSPVLNESNQVIGIVVGCAGRFTVSIPLSEELVLWPRLE